MDDLRAHRVDILTLGQYLRPTLNHLPVERFVTPANSTRYRVVRRSERGFLEGVSGPLVRSSYRAERALARNNAGLSDGALKPAIARLGCGANVPTRSRALGASIRADVA